MFKRQTLFILGAGASAEVDLPLGGKLAAVIGRKMDVRFRHGSEPIGDGDFELYTQIKHKFGQEADEYQKAAWRIRDGIGFAQSIDDFLDQHRANQRLNLYGKAAIVKSILEAEQGSKLYFDPFAGTDDNVFNVANFSSTWFVRLMQMLGREVTRENVSKIFERVSFIIFNYDRCVEYFLLHALQKTYGINESEAATVLDGQKIIHPYGSVGSLTDVPFGAKNTDYVAQAEHIKTYTEQIGSADVIAEISREMQRAQAIVFLGFAYHDQNMQMLRPKKPLGCGLIYGSAHGMSGSNVQVVVEQLARDFASQPGARIEIEHHTCVGLFDHYSKSLTGED